MPKVQLGKTESISVNRVWNSEADFSKWLHENLNVLGNALGCDLRSFGREIPVGRFRADLVAEMNGNYRVAIENQLDDSDHGHLGQCITYAAGLDAQALIWIAPSFRKEHLLAVERLNIGMGQNLLAFAVRIKVERSGSAHIPKFEMLASPDRWFAPSGEDVDYRLQRGFGFFERLREDIGDHRITVGPSTDQPFGAFSPSTAGIDHVAYTLAFRGGERARETSVHLWIETDTGERNRAIFDSLHRDQVAIEREVGHKLLWERSGPGRSEACAIRWRDKRGSIDDSPLELAQTRANIVDRFLKLREALDKRLPAAVAAAEK